MLHCSSSKENETSDISDVYKCPSSFISTVVPGLNYPCTERPTAVYNNFFIYGPISHAIRHVSNDPLADATNDLYIVTKPLSLPCTSDQITN